MEHPRGSHGAEQLHQGMGRTVCPADPYGCGAVKFLPTPLAGAFVVELEPISDARGMFARTYCEREFAAHGIALAAVQCNTSFNCSRDTLRGMHFQEGKAAEERV